MKLIMFPWILVLASLIPSVFAVDSNDQVNLLDLPAQLAQALGIPIFAAGILVAGVLMLIFMLPIAIYSRTLWPPLFVGILVMGFCISVSWLPIWFLFVLGLMIALMFSKEISGVLTGGSSRGIIQWVI